MLLGSRFEDVYRRELEAMPGDNVFIFPKRGGS